MGLTWAVPTGKSCCSSSCGSLGTAMKAPKSPQPETCGCSADAEVQPQGSCHITVPPSDILDGAGGPHPFPMERGTASALPRPRPAACWWLVSLLGVFPPGQGLCISRGLVAPKIWGYPTATCQLGCAAPVQAELGSVFVRGQMGRLIDS